MAWLQQLRIRSRILLVVLASCAASAVAISVSTFMFQDYVFRRGVERDLASLSRVVAAQCYGPLVFGDRRAGHELLAALRGNPQITSAALWLPSGEAFAVLGPQPPVAELRRLPEDQLVWAAPTVLRVRQAVTWQSETVGALHLTADVTATYRERQRLSVALFAAALLAAVAVGWIVSALLQGVISRPILRLTETAQAIAEARDYRLRVAKTTGGEVGWLTDAFNHMLGRIQEHDEALRQSNRALANEVSERLRTEAALTEGLRLEALNARVNRALMQSPDLEAVLHEACAALAAHLDCALVGVWTQGPEPEVLRPRASAAAPPAAGDIATRLAPAAGLVDAVHRTRQPLVLDDLPTDCPNLPADWVLQEGLSGVAAFPLGVGTQSAGVLLVASTRRFTDANLQAMEAVANALRLRFERHQMETALLESEKRFRDLFENAVMGIYRATPDGRMVLVNPALATLLGYASTDALCAAEASGAVHANAEERRAFCHRLITQGELRACETSWVRQDGQRLFASENARLVRDARGHPVYFESMVEDITARKTAEGELRRLHQEHMDLSRRAGMAEVATSVLHNVGNVLNSVNVSVNLLQANAERSQVGRLRRTTALVREHRDELGTFLTTDPKGRLVPDFLFKVSEALAQELAGWQAELRDLARNIEHIKEIVAMQQTYARVAGVIEPLAPRQLVEDALRICEPGLRRRRIRVHRDLPSTPLVAVDRHKILQILANLLRNAEQAMAPVPDSNRDLWLTLQSTDPTRIAIRVRDSGIGIASDHLARIFTHGFTTKAEGHGFGLHSSALAAAELGGSLTVHSPGTGQGATFTLWLPVVRPDPTTSPVAGADPPAEAVGRNA